MQETIFNRIISHAKSAIFLFGLSLSLAISGCQTKRLNYNKIKVFTPAEVKQDTDFLFRTLNEVHISPWNNISKQQFQNRINKFSDNNFWLQNRLEIYRQLAPLIAAFQESHTRLLYPSKLATADGYYRADFPLYLLSEIDGLYVAGDRTGQQQIPLGAQIKSINSVSTEQILSRMGQFVAEETESGQRRLIQMNFEQLLARELGFQAPYIVGWKLGYLETETTLSNVNIHAQTNIKKPHQSSKNKSWGVENIDSATRLLWITDFEFSATEFEQFLESFFFQLAQSEVKSLIIDLRYNWGGVSENVLNLLTYLQQQPIVWAKQVNFKNTEIFRKNNNQRIKAIKKDKLGNGLNWLPVEYLSGWNWRLLLGNDGEEVSEDIQTEVIPLAENRFKGQLAVISNGHCFSACALFVDQIKQFSRGIIVGEAAGSKVGVQYGYPILVTLPNTGLQLQLPAAEIRSAETAYKVLPDILVNRRSEDIANQRDPELAAALIALKVLR
jgi:hypothetical protein